MLKPLNINLLYKKYNIKHSKKFGQNFLVDQNVLEKIVNLINIKNQDVVEIGAGLGFLTLKLLEKVKTLISYEIDQNMIKVLKNEINNDKFTLVEGDFLKQEFKFKNKKILFGNIPYNITSDILFKLFKNSNKFSSAIIMVQKEVAKRLTSKVGSKNYGKLAISAKHFCVIKKEFKVSSKSFFPIPKVDSTLISLKFNNNDYESSKKFLEFIKNCFAMRRKTLFNNLKKFLNKEKAEEILLKNNFKQSIRPQELSYQNYFKMFNNI